MTFKIHTHLSSIVIFQFIYICWCLWYLKICLWCKSFLKISKCGLFLLPGRLISSRIYKFGHGIWNWSKALKILTFIFWKVLPWINEYLYLLMSAYKQCKQIIRKRPDWKHLFSGWTKIGKYGGEMWPRFWSRKRRNIWDLADSCHDQNGMLPSTYRQYLTGTFNKIAVMIESWKSLFEVGSLAALPPVTI